jgi:hypothetical protein
VESDDPGQALIRVAADWYITLQISTSTNRATIHPSGSVHATIGFLGPGAEPRWGATFAGEGASVEICGEVTREAMILHLLQLLRDASLGGPSPSVLLEFAGLATHLDQADRTRRAMALLSDMPRLASALASTRDPMRFATLLAASWEEERDRWDVLGSLLVGEAWGDLKNAEVSQNLFEAVPQAADMMSVLLFQAGRDCVQFVVQSAR